MIADDSGFSKTVDSLRQLAQSRSFTPNESSYRKKLMSRVKRIMGWNDHKADLWFKLENPLLGNMSPDNMIKLGRAHKVAKFIELAEEENGVIDANSSNHQK